MIEFYSPTARLSAVIAATSEVRCAWFDHIEREKRTCGASCVALGILGKPQLCGRLTALQILVEGLPADAKLPGHFGLAGAHRNARAQLSDSFGGEGLFAPLVGT